MKVGLDGLQDHARRRDAATHSWQAERRKERRSLVAELNAREKWALAVDEVEHIADSHGSITRTLAADQISAFVSRNSDLVTDVELHLEGLEEDFTTAKAATSADPGALQLSDSQGSGVGIWQTEVNCASSGTTTNYTLLGGTDSGHAKVVLGILRGVSPSWIYCKAPAVYPTSTEQDGVGGHPQITVINRSEGLAPVDTYSAADRDADDYIYNNEILIVKSAGNNGNAAVVTSPGKGLNVLTIGNYDDSTGSTDPASCGGNPSDTKNEKPELAAPGMHISLFGAEGSGTSYAAPHVAGLLADAIQAFPHLRRNAFISKAHMMAASTDFIGGEGGRRERSWWH
jgi:hypothetical protein